MTHFIVALVLKLHPTPPAHPIACSNPVKCHVQRGVIDRRDGLGNGRR